MPLKPKSSSSMPCLTPAAGRKMLLPFGPVTFCPLTPSSVVHSQVHSSRSSFISAQEGILHSPPNSSCAASSSGSNITLLSS